MINHAYKELYFGDSIDKQLSISVDDTDVVIENSLIYSEQFELVESICSDNQLNFGNCEASQVKFTIFNEIEEDLKGKSITITEVLGNQTSTPFTLGHYKVYSDIPNGDKNKRTVTAYDSMFDINSKECSEWYKSLFKSKDKYTLKEFRDSFFSFVGVEQVSAELCNDDMIVEETIDTDELFGNTVITSICQVNGVFGHINREGKFVYIDLTESQKGAYLPSFLPFVPGSGKSVEDYQSYLSVDFQNYTTQTITQVQVRQDNDDAGCIVGDYGNRFTIDGNFLLFGKNNAELIEIASNILTIIKDTYYIPMTLTCFGNPCIEVGDAINVQTKTQKVNSYVLSRRLVGVQGLKDTFTSKGEEKYTNDNSSLETQITALKGKTNTLTRNVDETVSRVEDVEEGLSETTQTADKINWLVKSGTSETDFEMTDEAINIVSENVTITNEDGSATIIEGGKVNVEQIFAEDVTATGTIEGATLTGANVNTNKTEYSYDEKGSVTGSKVYVNEISDGKYEQSYKEYNSSGGLTGKSYSIDLSENGIDFSSFDNDLRSSKKADLKDGYIKLSNYSSVSGKYLNVDSEKITKTDTKSSTTVNSKIYIPKQDGTLYLNVSDKRVFNDISTPIGNALDTINALDFISCSVPVYDEDLHKDYVIVPIMLDSDSLSENGFIQSETGGTRADGSINVACIDMVSLVSYLTKSVQELSAEVNRLKGV